MTAKSRRAPKSKSPATRFLLLHRMIDMTKLYHKGTEMPKIPHYLDAVSRTDYVTLSYYFSFITCLTTIPPCFNLYMKLVFASRNYCDQLKDL